MFRIALIVVIAVALAGCETIKGVGRDIENLGEGLDRATDGR